MSKNIKLKNYKFTYKEEGNKKLLSDVIAARNKQEAIKELKRMDQKVISISEETFLDRVKDLFKTGGKGGKIDKKTLSMLFKQLAFMRTSGLQLHRSVETLKNTTSNKNLKRSLNKMSKEISEGNSFSKALENQPESYSTAIVYQIRSGERSGKIEDTMDQIAHMLDKEVKFANNIKAALTYPVMVIVVTFFIVFFLMTMVVPAMSDAILGMGSELPFITLVVIKISDLVTAYGWVLALLTLSGIIVFAQTYSTSKLFRYNVDRALVKVPYVGEVILRLKIARFCRLLASLQGSGVQVVQSLDIVKSAMGNTYLEKKVGEVTNDIEQKGMSLPIALEEAKIFPELLIQLTMVGSESGTLQEVLELMADYFEEEVDDSLNKVLKYVDTILILFIGAIVGTVVISMFLPMFSFIGDF